MTHEMPFGPGCPWYSMQQTWGLPNVKWCEETICSLVNEPANAWSNLAMMVPALVYCLAFRKRKDAPLAWLAMSGFLMGLFSFIYHSTNNALTQYLDFVGMYLFVFFVTALNIARARSLSLQQIFMPYLASVAAMTLVTVMARQAGFKIQLFILFSIFGILATEWKAFQAGSRPAHYKAFVGTLASFGVAICFSGADVSRLYCDPHNHWVQGHAIWHVFSGVGMTIAFHHLMAVFARKPLSGNLDTRVSAIASPT